MENDCIKDKANVTETIINIKGCINQDTPFFIDLIFIKNIQNMKKVDMTSFYVYNVGEVNTIETINDFKSIMGNQDEE